jgi:hypothetical protein
MRGVQKKRKKKDKREKWTNGGQATCSHLFSKIQKIIF